jgi:tricorn protease
VGDAKGKNPRSLAVRTLASEHALRYRAWVEANRAFVLEQSGGRVGYVHIPDMGALGYSEFHRYLSREVERDALVVDVRYNGGGHVSELVLEKLARRRVAYCVSRWGQPRSYPMDAVLGPVVALTNEVAGSDGDIFSHGFKLLGLGPLVGTRTWGGVIGINPRHALADGSIVTQPEYSFWFRDVGFGVENYGTDPDVEVEITPQDAGAGRDPQLERSLALALEALERDAPRVPDFGDRPELRVPELV